MAERFSAAAKNGRRAMSLTEGRSVLSATTGSVPGFEMLRPSMTASEGGDLQRDLTWSAVVDRALRGALTVAKH